jgi:pyruvate/2-oxoglutarate/acetoin dehydrogenase E1 component
MNMCEATVAAIREEMLRDEAVFLTGFGVTWYEGILGSARGLWEQFGDGRVIEMPMAETGYFGICAGAAMSGMRPIFDIGFAEYIPYIAQPLCADMAAVYYETAGKARVPIVVAAKQGVTGNLSHPRGFTSWLVHVPGIKVLMASTAFDAKGLWKSAIRDNNPVVIIEPMGLYLGEAEEIPDEEYLVPIGEAEIKRHGSDISIIAAGEMTQRALEAAEALVPEGIDVEVVDLRTLAPMDMDTVLDSVGRTRRALIVYADWKIGGFGAEIAATIAERAGGLLKTRLRRLAPPHLPPPYAPGLEAAFFPSAGDITLLARQMVSEPHAERGTRDGGAAASGRRGAMA